MKKKVTRKIQPSPSRSIVEGASPVAPSDGHRDRILKTAMTLLSEGGRDALTTRAVAEAAHLQPPVLYRLFRDKAGLLNAVAEHGFGAYMATKHAPAITDNPVESLRTGWNLHIGFGLTHPELYRLMYADPHPGPESSAAQRAHLMLRDHMQRVASAGRLRVSEDRAAHLFHAAACGTVIMLLSLKVEQRDLSLSTTACDAALAAIVTDQPIAPVPIIATAATTLRALVASDKNPKNPPLFTKAEHTLLMEWLDRLATSSASR